VSTDKQNAGSFRGESDAVNDQNPGAVARETLKLLAARRVPPTPENYQRLYHEIAGTRPRPQDPAGAHLLEALQESAAARPEVQQLAAMARAAADHDWKQFSALLTGLAAGRTVPLRHDWAATLRELMRQLDGRQPTSGLARKKEGLERLLIHHGADSQLPEKLQALLRSWAEAAGPGGGSPAESAEAAVPQASVPAAAPQGARSAQADQVQQLRDLLAQTIDVGLAARLERFPELAGEARALAQQAREVRNADGWARFSAQLKQLWYRLEVRAESDEELLNALLRLLGLLVNNVGELVEDDRWVSGQLTAVREVINEPLSIERVQRAERGIKDVIYKQSMLKHSLREAKSTLKNLIGAFVEQLGEMSASTAGYHGRVERYAQRLETADDLPTLKGIVDELMSDTRMVQLDMQRYRDDISQAREQAELAEQRVRELEAELEQVSGQVREDQLTGTLNRRGLEDAMQREVARAERRKAPLCVAVLDLDNFKKLNDTYGHQAGDEALVHLTSVVKNALRPTDILARFGGEEFIILFGDTRISQAVEVMRRLQRELTRRFFLHNNERLLITFSAGVAALHPGETQESVFGRADKAMYQAKLQGKNRVVAADE